MATKGTQDMKFNYIPHVHHYEPQEYTDRIGNKILVVICASCGEKKISNQDE